MSRRTRLLLIAAVWACAVAACVLIALFPAFGQAIGRVGWPLGIFTGAMLGWQERGRNPDGRLPLFDKLLLLILAAFAGELVIPGLWGEIPAVALLGVSVWLFRRAR